MSFFKNLFRDRKATKEALRRYVELEFRGGDREAEYARLLREANL
jgi:hypothetical protein